MTTYKRQSVAEIRRAPWSEETKRPEDPVLILHDVRRSYMKLWWYVKEIIMLILIVDSDARRRVGLSFMLSKRGHTLQAAANPTNAIWILRQSQEPPRLILLDPGCEGENAEQLLSVVAETAPAAKVFRLLSPVCA